MNKYLVKIGQVALLAGFMVSLNSCDKNDELADGYGNFEADEVVVSSKVPGELIVFNVNEGQTYKMGEVVGVVDTISLHLQRAELEANKRAMSSKVSSVMAQLEVLKDERKNLVRENKRLVKLVDAGAATTQQLDDIEGKIQVVDSKIKSTRSQNPAIIGQVEAIEAKMVQLNNRIEDSSIKIPTNGIILHKIAEPFEYTAPGKPLFKIANIGELNLRVYLPQEQMSQIKLGQKVTVKIDGPNGEMIDYPGTISWVASEAEFTPKTIQTKETRVDLVYAVKIRVQNDGSLKIGMPAELWLQ